MCGRYYIDEGLWDEDLGQLLQQAVRVSAKLCADMKTAGEIRPTDIAPVIAPNALNRAMGAFPMQWGFAHPTRGMLVFNTRMETAPEKDLFTSSVNDRRCLIPASGYFEWKRADKNKKERFAFRAADEGPLFLAGLYIRTSQEHRLPCFTVLTQDAPKALKDIHPRMPVIVPLKRAEEWLSPDTDFHEMIHSLQPELLAEKA